MIVVLDVKAGSKSLSPDCSATFVDKKKRQRQTSGCVAPQYPIPKGTSGYVVLVFPRAEFGGTITYGVLDSNYNTLGKAKLRIA